MTTREQIRVLLSDGKARSVQELWEALRPLAWNTVQGKVTLMIRKGEIEVAAGRSAKPANATVARRYILAEVAA